MWKFRERLTYFEKLRRSLYEVLRDTLERQLMKASLIDSYLNHVKSGIDYTFVDKTELRPTSKRMEKESGLFNTFIVLFCEGVISPALRNHIRFYPQNRVAKKNLEYLPHFDLSKFFHKNVRHFDHRHFFPLLEELLDIDYALLIQQDASIKSRHRYALTHFHVKIDWPIADAAEDLGKRLRYIQDRLYEGGERKARILQNKLFEYYGCHHSVGGRRTAGLIAAQLFKQMDFITTIFVSSSESRSMYKYSERGVSKFFLVHLTQGQVEALASREGKAPGTFSAEYLYPAKDAFVGISEACYSYTRHSLPPPDNRLRPINPAYTWLKLTDEFLHPNLQALEARPITCSWVPGGPDIRGHCF